MSSHLGEVLSALLDRQLDADEESAALDHLARCEPCAAELATTRATRDLLRSLPPVDPPFPLVDLAPLGRRPGRLTGVLAAAAASVALLLLSGAQPEGAAGPQVAKLVQVHTTSPVNADPMSQVAPAALPVSFSR